MSIIFIIFSFFRFFEVFFMFHALDKVVCPFLKKYFDMPIWHPTDERSLDELLDAQVDMYVIFGSLCRLFP